MDYTAAKGPEAMREAITQMVENPDTRARIKAGAETVCAIFENAIAAARPMLNALDRHLRRPEVFETLGSLTVRIQKICEDLQPQLKAAADFCRHVENTPPAPGYESLLVSLGESRLEARFWSSFYRQRGADFAHDYNNQRPMVIKTIRKIAKMAGHVQKTSRLAAALVQMDARSWLLRLFDMAGHSNLTPEIINLLESAASGDPVACMRLAEFASTVAQDIPGCRGPKVSIPSMTHARILRHIHGRGIEICYTLDPISGDYTDEVTWATRIEFNDVSFNPTSAARRVRNSRRDEGF